MTLSILAASSKALGFIRELFMAWAFGTSTITDAYRLGLSFTTYASHFFFGEAMTGALVPYLADANVPVKDRTGVEKGAVLLALFLTLPIGAIFIWLPGVVLRVLTPGLPARTVLMETDFLKVFGVAIPLYCMTSIMIMVRQSRSDFSSLGWRPVGQSVAVLAGAALALLTKQPVFLPGAFAAYYLVLLIVVDAGELQSLRKSPLRAQTIQTLARWFPLAAGLGLLQSNVLIERYYASTLATGAIAALDYARVLTEIPLLVVAVPTGSVILVALRKGEAGPVARKARLQKLGAVGALLVISSVVLIFFSSPIVSLLYKRGAFDARSLMTTAAALRGLAAGAWAVAAGHITARWIMATRSPWALVMPSFFSIVVNVALAGRLTPKWGVMGVAVAESAGFVAYFLGAICHVAVTKPLRAPSGPGQHSPMAA